MSATATGYLASKPPLRNPRRTARRGGDDRGGLPPAGNLLQRPCLPGAQPRLSGRRLLLRALGLRDRLRLRRPLELHVAQGLLQAPPGASASDGHHGVSHRRAVLLLRVRGLPDDRRRTVVGGAADLPAGLYDAARAAVVGHPRLGRDQPAERPRMVAALRIHRQYPLCPRHPALPEIRAGAVRGRGRGADAGTSR